MELKGLEQREWADRAGAQDEIAGERLVSGAEPPHIAADGALEQPDDRDLQAAVRFHPDRPLRSDHVADPVGQRPGAGIRGRIAQLGGPLFQWITVASDPLRFR